MEEEEGIGDVTEDVGSVRRDPSTSQNGAPRVQLILKVVARVQVSQKMIALKVELQLTSLKALPRSLLEVSHLMSLIKRQPLVGKSMWMLQITLNTKRMHLQGKMGIYATRLML